MYMLLKHWLPVTLLTLLFSCGGYSEQSASNDQLIKSSIVDGSSDNSNDLANVIHFTTDDKSQCVGTAIHPYIILTAAHCVDTSNISGIYIGQEVRSHKVDKVKVLDTFIAEKYARYRSGIMSEHDIALVIVNSKLPLDESKMIRLMDEQTYQKLKLGVGDKLTISGFGKMKYGVSAAIRQYKEVEIIKRRYFCGDRPLKEVWNLEFSARNGDSGGPAFYRDGEKLLQVGISSTGSYESDKFCHRSYYTNIVRHLPWIKEKTGYHPTVDFQELSRVIERKYDLVSPLKQKGVSHQELEFPFNTRLKFNKFSLKLSEKKYLHKRFKTKIVLEHCIGHQECVELDSLWKRKAHYNSGSEIEISASELDFLVSNFTGAHDFLRVRLLVAMTPKSFNSPLDKIDYRKLTIDEVEESRIETLATITIPSSLSLNFSQSDIDGKNNLKRFALSDDDKSVLFRADLELSL